MRKEQRGRDTRRGWSGATQSEGARGALDGNGIACKTEHRKVMIQRNSRVIVVEDRIEETLTISFGDEFANEILKIHPKDPTKLIGHISDYRRATSGGAVFLNRFIRRWTYFSIFEKDVTATVLNHKRYDSDIAHFHNPRENIRRKD